MAQFQCIRPKGSGVCLAMALGFVLCLGCERGVDEPEGPAAASGPSAASRPFALPRLSDTLRGELPTPLVAKIDSAYQDAHEAPSDPVPVGGLAALYFVHGFADEAAQCLERAAELKPDEMPWYYCAGLAYEKAGRPAEARAAFERALALGRNYQPLYLHLADLVLADDPARAATLYQRVLDSIPTDASAHYGLGRVAAAEGRQEEALKHFHEALGLAPDYADAHRAAAEILNATGRQAEAQTHLRRAEAGGEAPLLADPVALKVRRRGLDPILLCSEAMHLALQSQFDQAEELIKGALALGGAGTAPRLSLAALRAMQKRYGEAAAEYQAVLEVDPDSLDAKSSLGQVYVDTGELEQAERLYREVLARRPDHAATLQRFSALMNRLGKPDEPTRVLREALQSDPQNETLRFRLGQLLASANRTAEALEHFRRALELRPEFLAARHALALGLEQSGDLAGAGREWEELLRANPKLRDGYTTLGRLMYQQQDAAALERVLRQGLEQLPDAHDLANTLAWHLATSPDPNQRNGAEAVEWAEKACELTQRRNHLYLDTLGAAYAEVGRFDDAVKAAREAMELATAARNAVQAEKYRRRITLYEWKQPYHESE
jgi:tetratricopeptide (TPR) repeat protein